MSKDRIQNLDYVRGLAALGIMIFHFTTWGFGDLPTDSFIKRLGLYGVSIFYVLSGLTLYHVYRDSMKPNWNDIKVFFIKRFFRIMPLLWLVTLTTVLYRGLLGGKWPSGELLLLNITGLFGFIAPEKYIATGTWSIGNEIVFYLFFPIFIFLYRKSTILLMGLGLGLLGIYSYFAFFILTNFSELSGVGFDKYVNPLNQVFLFFSGFLIGAFYQKRSYTNTKMLMLALLSLLTFTIYPTTGDAINLVTGVTRLIFSVLCIAVCVAAYKSSFQIPRILSNPLALLGEISYSLYLLHPLVWNTAGFLMKRYFEIPIIATLSISGLLSILCSYISFEYFEKFFIMKGRQLSYVVKRTEINTQKIVI